MKAEGKTRFFLFAVILWGAIFYSPLSLNCQHKGIKYIKNFSPKDYDQEPQNWSIVQDKRQIIYAANTSGLLEYDGVSWRSIDIPNRMVQSLTVAADGTIYVGGRNEIGFLAPGPKGTLRYVSLLEHLPQDQKDFGRVWKTHSTKEGIYFHSNYFLFRWNNKKMSVWLAKLDERFSSSFACAGELYLRQENTGLCKMVNDSLELLPGGGMFADKSTFMLVKNNAQELLIGTRGDGFYTYDGAAAEPFIIDADEYVKKHELSHGIRLDSGDFALATRRGGLVVIDSRGRIKYTCDENSGLQENNVKYVFEDALGNLWLALNKGIAKIEYASPISVYDKRSKLPGLVLSAVRHGSSQVLYAGTDRGLFFLSPLSDTFQPVPGMSGNCWHLLSINDSLLAATSQGVVYLKNDGSRKITKKGSFVLHPSGQDKRRIWAGTGNGLISLYKRNGQWQEESRIGNKNLEIRSIAEDKNGDLWLGTQIGEVLKVDCPAAGSMMKCQTTTYDKSHGLPPGWVNVFTAAGRIRFATPKGLYLFDRKTASFSPDSTFGKEFAAAPGGNNVFYIDEDKDKNIWLNSRKRNILARPRRDGSFEIIKKPFLRIPPAEVYIIYQDPDGAAVWFGGTDGLTRFDKKVKRDYDINFRVFIRRVTVNESPIYEGYRGTEKHHTQTQFYNPIPYTDRNLSFEFAAPFYEDESVTRYRYFLEGHDQDWSEWDTKTRKDYLNLDAGKHRFRVQAKNVYEIPADEAAFLFEISLPWYRTWWAFLSYVFIFVMMTYLVFKWQRSIRLEREKQRLEQIVKERTKEIGEKNLKLEKQTLQLKEQSEKLKEMDRVKSRFFANISHEFRTPLTLIMGPLEQMISESRKGKHKDRLSLMLRNSQRLLGLINQLLELSKFESGKMKLHAYRQNIIPFLKGIAASFEPLSDRNKVDLSFQAKENDITLYFDPEKLEEIIFNLLSNAFKFTPAGGKITVKVTTIDSQDENFPSGWVQILVSDTGPGIPRDQLAHIFNRFYQSDSTYEHHRKGSGIGLSIAKELVELHQGAIDVHSLEGKGTEFSIRLPMGETHLKAEEIPEPAAPPTPHKTSPQVLAANPPDNGQLEHVKPGTGRAGDPCKTGKDIILLVEDSADVRDYIRGAIEKSFAIIEAKDGREGIDKAREIIPDLIISDIMMPETDGYELCRILKNDIKTSHIPIILLTAKSSEENILQGLETGADDYITKPFNTRILCARIKNLIDLRFHLQQTLSREMSQQPTEIYVSQIDRMFIKKFKKVIDENISDPDLNVEQLCKIMDMSQPTMYRKIQALFGDTPTEYIQSYRLNKGAEILRTNKTIPIIEVAFEVGFSSAGYFSKCFKKKFHQLPTTYRAAEAGTS